ncbi:MAG TPA: methenyltetrahydromethanopterin cyclohydrolase [Halobacteria archaeon]|jgi:methenyltetrahydromethanopterin cyclohydrolase|nr:methenyltetrahydromethanopterin cyclohydrolase [Halobacteria archaeon]
MISVNEGALDIVESMLDWEEELNIAVDELKNGSLVIDCGVNVKGSYQLGTMFTEICMGGLGTANIAMGKIKDIPFPFVHVTVDHPAISCLASQKAGWSIKVGNYFAMGSGPARALALKPKDVYERIDYEDDSDYAIIALEADKLPNDEVMKHIADACDVDPSNLYAVVAPTRSLVGSVQISGRVVENALHILDEFGYDVTKIANGAGFSPVAPIKKDAMGVTNDCNIYYGSVYLTVDGYDDVFSKVPSINSKDYGKPFAKIFKDAGYDFFKIDEFLFAPARITVNDKKTGEVYCFGRLNPDIILESFGVRQG